MTPSEAQRLVALHFRDEFPLMWVEEALLESVDPYVYRVKFSEAGKRYESVVSGSSRGDLTYPTLID